MQELARPLQSQEAETPTQRGQLPTQSPEIEGNAIFSVQFTENFQINHIESRGGFPSGAL